jgi:2-amino-4-hydroxy-6-hydroxymethyldihydropteridine diphosphokinase
LKTAYLSLGSNLGNREEALQSAIDLLRVPALRVVRVSSVYETAPVDYLDQPDFLNLVAQIETSLFPLQLLSHVQKIERQLGRRRMIAKGPRTIDIDILLYGNAVVGAPQLAIPHPAMTERRFVLEPLAEIVPGLRHPLTRKTVGEMLSATVRQPLRKVEFRPVIRG